MLFLYYTTDFNSFFWFSSSCGASVFFNHTISYIGFIFFCLFSISHILTLFVFTCCCWNFCQCLFLICILKSLSNTVYLLMFYCIVMMMHPKDFLKRVLRINSSKLTSHAYLCMSLSNACTWLKELLSKLPNFYGKLTWYNFILVKDSF